MRWIFLTSGSTGSGGGRGGRDTKTIISLNTSFGDIMRFFLQKHPHPRIYFLIQSKNNGVPARHLTENTILLIYPKLVFWKILTGLSH